MSFDYQGARNEGYSDNEILDYLSQKHPDFDVKSAVNEGYGADEIFQYLSSKKPSEQKQEHEGERSIGEQAARVAGQFGVGLLEAAALPYEVGVAPLAIPGGQEAIQDLFTREILSDVYPKEAGDPIIQERELREPVDIGVRGLIEKATGADLKPEGILEKAASWVGFIKDPRKIFELGKTGLTKGQLMKAIAPTGKEALRGAGAGTALQLAEDGEFGPIGTMAAAVIGDISGNVALSASKAIKKIVTNPRQALAEVAAMFTKKDKLDLQKQIVKDFRDANIQADVGTLTNSDMVKWVQTRLAQSGLTGDALDDLKKTLTTQIKEEYKAVAESVGEARFAAEHEAGSVLKTAVEDIKEADLNEARSLYKEADNLLNESSFVNPARLAKTITRIEDSLKHGNYKSSEQLKVLEILQKVKSDIHDSAGDLIYGKVKSLMNDKLALNEAINYEVQGGVKQLLKEVVSEIDRTIISHRKDNPAFARKYIQANKYFSEHAKTFRNKNISQLLKTHDPATLMNRFNSVQGIRDIKKVLNQTSEGQKLFRDLSRLKLDKVVGDHLIDSITQQAKFGTFSKILEKGKNRELIRELLPSSSYSRLIRLQRNSGVLSETAQKFMNASKSGVTIADAGIVAKVMTDLGHLLSGNPWPLVKTGTSIAGARYLTKLMGDPNFLKLVEEAILASQNNDLTLMTKIGKQIADAAKPAINETRRENNQKEK